MKQPLVQSLIKYSVLGICFLALGFSYRYYVPKLETFLLKQIVSLGKRYSPIDFKIQNLNLRPLTLGVEAENIELFPRGNLKANLKDIKIKSIYGRLSLLSLLRGEIRLGVLEVSKPELFAFINFDNRDPNSKIEIPLNEIFRLPINEIRIQDLKMTGRIDPQATVFKIENLNLVLENRFRSLWLDLKAPTSLIKPSGPTQPIELQTEIRGSLEENQIRLSALKVKRKESYLVSSGFFWGDISKGHIKSSEMATRMHFKLESLKDWVAAFKPDLKLPEMSGRLGVHLKSGFKENRPFLSADLLSKNVKIGKFELGDASLSGDYFDSKIKVIKGKIKNSSGQVDIENASLNFSENYEVTGTLKPNIELGALLKTIGLKEVPVQANIEGKASCQGQLKNPLRLNCQNIETTVNNMAVHLEKGHGNIVSFKTATATGSAEITEQEVKYSANLTLGSKSKGKSEGTINYQKGFQIFYEGTQVDFDDIDGIVGIKFQGNGNVKGETKGNAHTATLDLKANFENFWLDDYGLGSVSSDVKYQNGLLHFRETKGLFQSTRYAGHLSINVVDEEIYLYVKSPFLELSDVKDLLVRRLPIPIPISGSGTGEFKAHGPLDIKHMNYDINAKVFRGAIAQESYDSIDFSGSAIDGVLTAQRAAMTKGRGNINLTGSLSPRPDWNIDLTLIGQKLRLEQSENLSKFGLDIQGQYQFQARLTDDIRNPRVSVNGQTQKLVVGDQAVADSNFSLKFLDSGIEGTAGLIGDQVKTEFLFPKTDNDPFRFKMETKEWDISKLFEALSKSQRAYDFETSLTMKTDLYSPSGGFWKSSGQISIDNFFVRRGSQVLSSDGSMKLHFNQGVINSENFGLSGGENFLRLNAKQSTLKNIDAQLNGKIDLNMLGLFFPFASDIRGLVSINSNLNGPIEDLRMTGSAYLDKGYIKARDFPHPFTDLKADVLFNQKTIFLNSLRGEVAGGKISGDGNIRFENRNSIPIHIRALIDKASLNFPENYKTRGSAQLEVSGTRLPYLVKMQYDMSDAEITSEFGGGESSSGIRESPYLPPSAISENNAPFYLDLDLLFQKPIRISNSILQGNLSGNLNIRGSTSELLFKGGLTFQPGGIVYFRDVPFEVSTGYIEYLSTTPDNPKLYLTASTRVGETVFDSDRRQTERQYDVNLLVQGRGREPQVTLTSQPPLPQKDIVSLLALGLTPEALDESRNTGLQMTSTSTAIGAALLQKPVGKRLKDRFGVDMKVSTSQASVDTTSAAKVTFSKQFTPKIIMSASGTLEANPQSSVKLEYQFNRGLSVIGSWEGKEQGATPTERTKDTTNSILGLDLEYKVQFK